MKDLNQACSDIRADLPLSVGGDLDATRLERVEGHLETCEGCRREADRLSASRRVFQELGAGASGSSASTRAMPDLWPAVRSGLQASGLIGGPSSNARVPASARVSSGTSGQERGATAPIFPLRRLAAAAAVLVALLTAAALWGGGPESEGQRSGTSPTGDLALPAVSDGAESALTAVHVPGGRVLRLADPGERGLLEDAQPLGGGLDLFSLRALASQRRVVPLPGVGPALPEGEGAQPLLEEPQPVPLSPGPAGINGQPLAPFSGGIQIHRIRVR